MTVSGRKQSRKLVLLSALSTGCVHQAERLERPDLVERVIRTQAEPAKTDQKTTQSSLDDPSLKRASAEKTAEEGDSKTTDGNPSKPKTNSDNKAETPTETGAAKPREAAQVTPRPFDARVAIPAGDRLTLEAARDLAMQYSPLLAQARASVDISRGNLDVTDSGFYPTIQGNYGYQAFSSQVGFTGTRGRFPVLPVRGFGPGTQDFHVTEAQLKWTIFQFGKQLSKHAQAVLKTEIANLQMERTCQTVAYEVAQAYYRVLEAESAVDIANKAVERAEAILEESASLLRRGVITQEEHLRTEARLAEVRQERTDAKSEEEVAIAGLNKAIGINVNTPTKVVERREAPGFDQSLEQALNLAVANRREIPVVVRGITTAEEGVNIARADFLPTVSIQAGYSNVTGTGIQNANVGAGGIFLTQELYGGGRRRGQLFAAQAQMRSAVAQAQQVCDDIAYEVNVAYRGLEDSRERIKASRVAFQQAEENQRLVNNRSRTGDATPAEVVEARALLTRAEQTYNASFYQYQRSLSRLEFAVGAELPVTRGEIPASPSVREEPAGPPKPSTEESPFRPRTGVPSLPGLPPPVDFGGPTPARPTLVPLPPAPGAPESPGLFGPPTLSRPPYESNSPIGNKP